MSAANFQLVFDGEAVRDGSMDVYELAPALLATGNLIKEANTFLNGERATVSVRVESDFKRSSFEIGLLLDQGLVEQAKQLVLGDGIRDAEHLLKVIFGVGVGGTALLTGLIQLYKALKGEKISEVTVVDNSTTIIQTGSGQILNNVDKTTVELYRHDSTRIAVQRVLKPLRKPGIDVLEIRRNKETVEKITKEEALTFVEDSALVQEAVETPDNISHRNTVLRLVKPSFRRGNKYQVMEGDNEYYATIEDQQFLDKVDSDEVKFAAHDRFRVRLRQEITPGEKKDEIQHFVEEVISHDQARPAAQTPLLYTDQDSTSQTDET